MKKPQYSDVFITNTIREIVSMEMEREVIESVLTVFVACLALSLLSVVEVLLYSVAGISHHWTVAGVEERGREGLQYFQ